MQYGRAMARVSFFYIFKGVNPSVTAYAATTPLLEEPSGLAVKLPQSAALPLTAPSKREPFSSLAEGGGTARRAVTEGVIQTSMMIGKIIGLRRVFLKR